MDLLIKIPKEFEQHFKQDAFDDSLHRLSADAHLIAGLYEQETAAMLIESLKNAVTIPAHGRCIDADEFLKRAIGTKCFRGDYARMLEELVGESTSIIPAEEGET